MSNLNNNTTQLEILLAKVNALPEAGSGGAGIQSIIAAANSGFKVTTENYIATIDWDLETELILDGGTSEVESDTTTKLADINGYTLVDSNGLTLSLPSESGTVLTTNQGETLVSSTNETLTVV